MEAHRVEIVEAAAEHIEPIATRVRSDDRQELAAVLLSPESALRYSLRNSLAAWTGIVDGVPICMFGVCPGEMLEGRPWMIGTSDLDTFAAIFLRRCRGQVERMLQVRPVLVNYVAAGNVRAVEWLIWLGFKVETPATWGPREALFHRFSMRREP